MFYLKFVNKLTSQLIAFKWLYTKLFLKSMMSTKRCDALKHVNNISNGAYFVNRY